MDNNFGDNSTSLTDLNGSESNNKDKSLHGLAVALAMAIIIAGSVILFAYASSEPMVSGTAGTNEIVQQPEKPVSSEKVADESVPVESDYVDNTARLERLAYDEPVTQSSEVSARTTKVELGESMSVSESGDEPGSTATQSDQEERDEERDGPAPDKESNSNEQTGLLNLLDDIIDSGDDEKPGKEKGKDHKGKD